MQALGRASTTSTIIKKNYPRRFKRTNFTSSLMAAIDPYEKRKILKEFAEDLQTRCDSLPLHFSPVKWR